MAGFTRLVLDSGHMWQHPLCDIGVDMIVGKLKYTTVPSEPVRLSPSASMLGCAESNCSGRKNKSD
jgi:hypothetical protein